MDFISTTKTLGYNQNNYFKKEKSTNLHIKANVSKWHKNQAVEVEIMHKFEGNIHSSK